MQREIRVQKRRIRVVKRKCGNNCNKGRINHKSQSIHDNQSRQRHVKTRKGQLKELAAKQNAKISTPINSRQ